MTDFWDHAVESAHRVFIDMGQPWRCLDCEARSVMWDMTDDPCGGNVPGGSGCVCDPPFGKGLKA